MAPAVENPAGEEPVQLKVYEFSDGARLKLTAKDAQTYQANLDRAAADRPAWERGATSPAVSRSEPAEAVVPLTILKKDELVALAEARGLSTSGSKAAIAARFVAGDEADDDDSTATDPDATGSTGDGDQPPA